MLDRERLLANYDSENLNLPKFLDICERVLRYHEPELTDFLDPYHAECCREIIEQIPDIKYKIFGGFPEAERKRFSIYPDYYLIEMLEDELAFVEINARTGGAELSHRHFLGALTSLGIKREKLGDLLVDNSSCQVVISEDIKDFLLSHLKRVDRFDVEIKEIDPEQLKNKEDDYKEISSTVASLRLDSVASSGFGTSRTKMARAIKQGNVKVNWTVEDDPAYKLEPEDIISIRGRGRVEIDQLMGKSNRGRLKLILKRYI